MTCSLIRARKIAKRILTQHESGRSYRDLAKDFLGVKAGTLNRFAKSEGKWIPKNENLQIALGLKTPHKPKIKRELLPGEKETKKRIALMAKNLRNSFKEFLS